MPQSAVTITCPKCNEPIELTEALAAPMLASARAEFNAKLQTRQQELTREMAAKTVEAERAKKDAETERQALAKEKATLEQQRREEEQRLQTEVQRRTEEGVGKQLAAEKKRIAEDERRRAETQFADQLAERDRDAQAKDERIAKLSAKNSELTTAQAELLRRQEEFAEKEREFDLRLQTEVSGQLDQVRAVAASQAEQRLGLQLSDKDRTIRELAAKLEDATRKAQQGSQQAQGETLELVLEEQLRRCFPFDELQPVPKGEFGGDTLQVVRDGSGRECGRILWEFKRTKTWSAAWLPKLKGDQRAARADLAVLVSQAMPPDVQHFNEVDGVWVSSLGCTLPVATALRASLMQLAGQRRNAQGQQTKSELIYAYLTGPQFRGRIEAIAERWQEMREDLQREKTQTMTRWSKREKQLETLLTSTTGIWGDLQGIAGRDLAEIRSLEGTLMLQGQVGE